MDRFINNKKISDTQGKPVEAHGFTINYDEKKKIYYWYGENKEFTKKGGNIWTYGINLYKSKDLYNWEKVKMIIPPSEDINDPLHPTYCIDRPHILYNENNKKYICWIKVMAGEVSQFMVVMSADNLEGPYEYVHKMYKPLKMDSGDFTLVKDNDKAYIIFERPHFELITATLNEDYTEVTGEYSEHYVGLLPPETREAPTYFKYNGRHYLITSGTSGYYSNPSRVCVFDDFHGEYEDLGNPCVDDKHHNSFNSQFTSVISAPNGRLIACGDRWMPYWYINLMSGSIVKGMKKYFADYVPDKSPKEIVPLEGKLQVHNESTCDATFVFLPLDFKDDKPVINYKKEWKWEDE